MRPVQGSIAEFLTLLITPCPVSRMRTGPMYRTYCVLDTVSVARKPREPKRMDGEKKVYQIMPGIMIVIQQPQRSRLERVERE
jgi:hypothetical protein